MKKNIFKNQDGATIIEYAIIAPVLFLLLMGIIEMGLFFYASNVIENATVASSRFGITGQEYKTRPICPNSEDRSAFIRCSVERYSRGVLDPADVRIQAKVISGGFENVNPEEYDFGEDERDYGGANQAVVYRVSYTWKFFTPLIGKFFSDDGEYDIESTVLIRNENFE